MYGLRGHPPRSAVAVGLVQSPTQHPMKFRFPNPQARFGCLLLGLAGAASAVAQSDAADSEGTDDVIQLSPFEVRTDNRGYLASTALSGTRLNTRLEDIAPSITVVTRQQMLDTASTGINDVFLYEASTEGTGNYTSFTANRDGGVVDNVQNDPYTANRVRGLGSANIAIANFPANPSVPFDLYNMEAVEISRGPNSNIFGLGTGSGTVNIVPATAHANRSISSITLRADSFGGHRASFDFNRPLIDEKLGVRVAALHEDKGFELEPSREEIRRVHGSVVVRPFRRTMFRATAENYRNDAQRPNSITPRESITDWKASGEPTWDPTTMRVRFSDGSTSGPFRQRDDGILPDGLRAVGNDFYRRTPLMIDRDGSITYWGVNRTGNLAGDPTPLRWNQDLRMLQSGTILGRTRETEFPLFFEKGVTDKSVYDWSSINYVAPNLVEAEADTIILEFEQFMIDTPRHLLGARVGWFQQNYERYNRSMVSSNDTMIFIDVNEKLLDGSANPNFRRPYVAGAWPITVRDVEDDETASFDVVYQLTPDRRSEGRNLFGQQRLNLHGERRETSSTNYRHRDFVVSDHSWISPVNRLNSTQTIFQYYLGDSQGANVDYAPTTISNLSGTYPFNWFNAQTNTWVTESATLGEEPIDGTDTDVRRIDSLNLTYQGFFLDDRVVTTIGLRNDEQRIRSSDPVAVDPATGRITYDPLQVFDDDWVSEEGDTTTYGIVVKPTPWLSLFYNRADSFNPQPIQYNIFGELMKNPTSEGEDYGFSLSLLDGRFVLKVNRYEVLEMNSRRGQIGTVGSRVHRLEGARQPYAESFLPWAENVVRGRFQQQGITPTAEQVFNAAAELMQLDPVMLAQTAVTGAVGEPVDLTSKGYEFEAIYNPSRNWRIKFTAAQQKAIDSNIGDTITRYLEERLPVWTTVTDDEGNRWWDASNGAARLRYLADIRAPYLFEVANAGKPRSQVREWRWSLLSNYEFTSGPLTNWSFGGAVRWQDKAAIGFYGRPPEDGMILELDPERPIWDKARTHLDLNVAYRFRLFDDKLRGRIQLNVRDVFEDGRLQAVAANPDGQPYAFRIIDPRQFILSTTFDF